MFQAAAGAATEAVSRDDGSVSFTAIVVALTSEPLATGKAAPLRELLLSSGVRGGAHTRYFVRGAKALGLLEFNDVRQTLDLIAHPRLSAAVGQSAEHEHRVDAMGETVGASVTAVSDGVADST
jgi:hypothetical protein